MKHNRITDLVARLSHMSTTWLPPSLPRNTSLDAALAEGEMEWPAGWDDTGLSGSALMFPFPYAGQVKVSPALFHQLVDAACEAERAASEVLVVTVPTGRSGPRHDAARTASLIAAVFRDAGFPVTSAGDVSELPGIGTHLVAQACTSPLTRRHVDLTDMLVAAASAALGCEWTYRTNGVAIGRNLGSKQLCPPLCRLYDPGDPFASPPADAKRPPSGSDAVWAAALTLGATATAAPTTDRYRIVQPVVARLGTLWKNLQRKQLCGSAPTEAVTALRLRVDDDFDSKSTIGVPLFGAPVISESTRAFVTAVAMMGRPELVVDDLTPRFCYQDYPINDARASYAGHAAALDGTVRFVSDIPELEEQLHHILQTLAIGNLTSATASRQGRRRCGVTGYDAIHLAVMTLACSQHPRVLAVRSANVAAVRAMTPVVTPSALVAVSGDHPDIDRLRADLPAHHLAQETTIR